MVRAAWGAWSSSRAVLTRRIDGSMGLGLARTRLFLWPPPCNFRAGTLDACFYHYATAPSCDPYALSFSIDGCPTARPPPFIPPSGKPSPLSVH